MLSHLVAIGGVACTAFLLAFHSGRLTITQQGLESVTLFLTLVG